MSVTAVTFANVDILPRLLLSTCGSATAFECYTETISDASTLKIVEVSAAEAELAGVLLILAADVRFGQQHGSDLRPKERRDGS